MTNMKTCVLLSIEFFNSAQKRDFSLHKNFENRNLYGSRYVIRYKNKNKIKIFENFKKGRGTQTFWFLETSMEVDNKIPKSTN